VNGGASVIARDYTNESNISKEEAKTLIETALTQANNIGVTADGEAAKISSSDITKPAEAKFTLQKGTAVVAKDLTFNLHVGADADMTNKIGVSISSMSAAGLGVHGLNVADDSGVAATYAIDAIADAISTVSAQRSALGAVQNRLEHTINNVDNVVENTTSAESRIRDTDMAEEMVEYSKNNILAQAGQSMLAQANQSNQGVLSLLG
jgi:flagellin